MCGKDYAFVGVMSPGIGFALDTFHSYFSASRAACLRWLPCRGWPVSDSIVCCAAGARTSLSNMSRRLDDLDADDASYAGSRRKTKDLNTQRIRQLASLSSHQPPPQVLERQDRGTLPVSDSGPLRSRGDRTSKRP